MRAPKPCVLALLLAPLASAQFPPQVRDITVKQLQNIPGASLSYKETNICESTAKAWAGYVNLPASVLGEIETSEPYNLSMFFWYFEARQDPRNAPTAIYLAGGPGEPGVSGAVGDGGPCYVLEDSKTTVNNPYSWNTYVNMLYIDQPVSTGFSFTKAVNSTLDLLFLGSPLTATGIVPFEAYDGAVPPQNTTFIYGTFSEQDEQKTPNSTLTAAKTIWHFSQAWFSSFPQYNTCNKNLNIFGNSYGGYFVPITAEYFTQQNARIRGGQIDGTIIPIDTIGWTNGCVDQLIQADYYPDMAYNNTYGLQVIPEDVYNDAKNNFTKQGGCADLIKQCRELGDKYDPDFLNDNESVIEACVNASSYCQNAVIGAYDVLSNRSDFDMADLKPDPNPPTYWYGYLNQDWVLKDLGVPVNLSTYSLLDNNVFLYQTGDPFRTTGLKSMETLLNNGVKVAMIYGDRDYRCPWNGAEALSLVAEWADAEHFRNAGYEYIQTNASYQGGVVRQYGNFSFSRVFQAGHDAQWYQPETVFRLFNRAIFSQDLATGGQNNCGTVNDCVTSGPLSSFHIKDVLPAAPPFDCNLLSVGGTCTIEQFEALRNGTARTVDYKIVEPAGGSPGSILGIL